MHFRFFLPMLLQLAATARRETRCTVESQEKLMCKFPQDVNKTQIGFGVYFYSDNGVEEPLVDCVWRDLQFHCIRQKGFECQTPVSDTVVVSMPSSLAYKRGIYRCIPHGYSHKTAKPCWYPAVENERNFAACEASTTFHGLSVTVNCTFSFRVDSFEVLWNNSALAKYTKSSCQHSHLCHYMPSNNTDVFSVTLNVSSHQDEFVCLPNAPLIPVKKCSITTKIQGSYACTVVVRLPFVVLLVVLSKINNFGLRFWPREF